jgi:hypothetical protein
MDSQPNVKLALQDPTPEQLAMAFRHLARPGWPCTLELALEKHSYRTALVQVARNLGRAKATAKRMHALPQLPAPDTPGPRELTGSAKYGRSPYSIATGPMTELTSWRGSSPKQMMAGAPHIQRKYFDVRKAAANDLDD